MSNIPTPKNFPPTTQQVDATLRSVIAASQTLINEDPKHFTNLRATFMQFYSHPTFQLILGLPAQQIQTHPSPDNQLKAELAEIKSTIAALSKAVSSQQPKAKGVSNTPATQTPPPKGKPSTQGQGSGNVTPPTFASKAAVKSRPSLVLDLEVSNPHQQPTTELVTYVNDRLYAQGHQHVTLSAAKWTSKGNLVVTAHHTVTQVQFKDASPIITSLLREAYPDNFSQTPVNLTARANVKWSKILINSVPIGISETRGPWTPEECHRALTAHNPSYTALTITQKPSWVRNPSTYKKDDHSSLVVAFEDPDGLHRRSLLSNKQLYLLGVRAKVTRWKETPQTQSHFPPPTASSLAPLIADSDSSTDLEELERRILAPGSPVPDSSAHQAPQRSKPQPQRTTRSRKTKG